MLQQQAMAEMFKLNQRAIFKTTKKAVQLLSNDPRALNKAVQPVARLLSYMPGNTGRYWEQIYFLMAKDKYSKVAMAEFEECVSQLKKGSICVDLGANVGVITRKLASSGATVHAFEPDPWTFEQLREAVGHLPNVILHNAAVGSHTGTIPFFRPKAFADSPIDASIASTTLAKNDESQCESFEVDCVNFVEFLQGLGQSVDLIKIDIEGAEVELLKAIIESDVKTQIGSMFVETHYNIFTEQTIPISKLRYKYASLARPYVNFDWP